MDFLQNTISFIRDKNLNDFIFSFVNSSLKLEILDFIYCHPFFTFDSSLISEDIGRDEQEVQRVLSEFEESQLIKQVNDGPSGIYIFSRDRKFENLLDSVIKLFDGRQGREALSYILNK